MKYYLSHYSIFYNHSNKKAISDSRFIIIIMSIKVGVRVRPFNQREIELNCRLCIEMQGQTTRLVNVNDTSKNRDFAFDYSFWSHDEFDVEESGYFT